MKVQIKDLILNLDPVPRSRTDLKAAVFAGCAAIPQEQLNRAIDSFYYRCKLCLSVNGDRFEYELD